MKNYPCVQRLMTNKAGFFFAVEKLMKKRIKYFCVHLGLYLESFKAISEIVADGQATS